MLNICKQGAILARKEGRLIIRRECDMMAKKRRSVNI